jgi:protein-S-isoprenylcysteine O-methyltransferase Ste14
MALPASAGVSESSTSSRALDLVERVLVLGWYGYFVWRLLPGENQSWLTANWLLLISESLVIFLLLIRRQARSLSINPTDWLIATTATLLPLSVAPLEDPKGLVPPVVGAILLISGMIIQIRAKISLGRSVGMVPADRGIKRGGPYQMVRHPMYTGYLVSWIGFLLLHPSVWNISIYAMALAAQIIRVLAEERFLAQNEEYRTYMSGVRYRLIPGLF